MELQDKYIRFDWAVKRLLRHKGAMYGVLYDRAASLAEGLCPAGYELPDDETLLRALLYAGAPMPAGLGFSVLLLFIFCF